MTEPTTLDELRLEALRAFLLEEGEDPEELEEIEEGYTSTVFEYGSAEYLVLLDEEADDAFKESIESYVDDCVLPQLPENLRFYFDLEAFTRDVELSDGRGPSLAGYDGAENEAEAGGEYFYIYRVN